MKREAPTPDAMPSRIREMPTWLISRAYAYSHRLLADGFATAGVRGHHYRVLAALEELGPASQAELGRRTGIDRSDVVAVLNDLAARGLIERSPDPADRRRNIITMTPAGGEELGTLDEILAAVQEQVLTPLSAAERKQLVGLLARLLEHDAQASRTAS
ncbi:MAG: MarR family transcriptional regulator, lower aerobic nicotinate degradation pathway regulator [Baekduia sp.]|jgi:DNA-binding MarR family transcriptional regulator|nr:MarR family transcriptional regulator, lower aerobic nicotinate degradation pathway regulator [Baekduia sp.]